MTLFPYTTLFRSGQGRDAARKYLKENPEVAAQLEADIRANFYKLMNSQSKNAAKAAGRAVDVSAEDFDDGAAPDDPSPDDRPPDDGLEGA